MSTAEPGSDRVHRGALLEVAVRAAEAGAEVLRGAFRADDLQIRSKGRHDFVTRADHESEAAVLEVVRAAFPGHDVLAEESGHEVSAEGSGYQWIVDPLDGTSNFLQGVPMFCVSVACRRGDSMEAGVVLDPLRGDLFAASAGGGATWNGEAMRVSERDGLDDAFLATGFPFRAHRSLDRYLECFREVFLASRGIRRLGAAALDLAYTAAGVFDGFFEFRLSPWDLAAGTLLIREAGGVVTDLDGGDGFLWSGNVLAGPAGVHAELRAAIGGRVTEADVRRLEGSPAHDGDAPVA